VFAELTASIALYSSYVSEIVGFDLWALVDSLLFGVIAIGVWYMSRVAAVCGLLLYLSEKEYTLTTGGEAGNGAVVLLFLMRPNKALHWSPDVFPEDQFESTMRPTEEMIEEVLHEKYMEYPETAREQLPFETVMEMVKANPGMIETAIAEAMPEVK
jgi:hypothetical protein